MPLWAQITLVVVIAGICIRLYDLEIKMSRMDIELTELQHELVESKVRCASRHDRLVGDVTREELKLEDLVEQILEMKAAAKQAEEVLPGKRGRVVLEDHES